MGKALSVQKSGLEFRSQNTWKNLAGVVDTFYPKIREEETGELLANGLGLLDEDGKLQVLQMAIAQQPEWRKITEDI